MSEMIFTDDGVEWPCGACGERTSQTHFRQGADGVMFHAGPDAPPSDETYQPQNFVSIPVRRRK